MKEGEPKEPSLFDQMNDYLKKEAPEGIPDPTVQGIAERMGIPEDVLNTWLVSDKEFRETMIRLKDFQANEEFKDGSELDYFVHATGIQWVLDETRRDIQFKL